MVATTKRRRTRHHSNSYASSHWKKQCRSLLFGQKTALLRTIMIFFVLSLVLFCAAAANEIVVENESDSATAAELPPHPDLNEEDHEGMIYVGRLCHETGRRLSADHDNTVRYVFGTAFDDSHKSMELADLQHQATSGPDIDHDLPHAATKTREQVLKERRHKNLTQAGPVPFGHVETHALDGGVTPVQAVAVQPFWLDARPVTNKQFAKFVKARCTKQKRKNLVGRLF